MKFLAPGKRYGQTVSCNGFPEPELVEKEYKQAPFILIQNGGNCEWRPGRPFCFIFFNRNCARFLLNRGREIRWWH